MILSPDQVTAYDAMGVWERSGSQEPFSLGGFAGSGKTTIVQQFINNLNVPVICCAPTGKACEVLRRRLDGIPVTTIHRVLYTPVAPPSPSHLHDLERQLAEDPFDQFLAMQVSEERFRLEKMRIGFQRKKDENRVISEGDLVIVDESSMVTNRMYDDFQHTGARVLFVGDPGQLPPVGQNNSFFDLKKPDACLTEIHRQAADSPILRLSMRIREGQHISPFDEPKCRKAPKSSMPFEDWLKFDQVITGSNVSRRRVNRFFRKVKQYQSDFPLAGEKLICLHNAEELFFVNGAMAETADDFVYSAEIEGLLGDIIYNGERLETRSFDPFPFRQNYEELKDRPYYVTAGMADFLQFDYAYAITAHKAQGSEFDRVIVADDQMKAYDKEFRRRWLYTAVTRAKEELVWLY